MRHDEHPRPPAEAPRCATCGRHRGEHGFAPDDMQRRCFAFVPPADAKPAEACECEPPQAADDHGYVCPVHEPIGRDSRLTPEQNQRASFAYGNTKLSNSDVTWEMCVQAVLAKDAEPAPAALREAAEAVVTAYDDEGLDMGHTGKRFRRALAALRAALGDER